MAQGMEYLHWIRKLGFAPLRLNLFVYDVTVLLPYIFAPLLLRQPAQDLINCKVAAKNLPFMDTTRLSDSGRHVALFRKCKYHRYRLKTDPL
jgi:hypothetical protein